MADATAVAPDPAYAAANRISESYWDTVEKTMNPLMGTITLLREATAEEFASPAYIKKSQEALDYAIAGMEMLDPNSPDAKALSVAILKMARFLSLDWSSYNESDIPEVHNTNWLTSLTASGCMPCQLAAQEEARRAEKEHDPNEEYPATARWEGVIGYENQMTGDGRFLEEGSLRWENLPIVMRYVSQDVGAHDGAQVVANIDTIERLAAEEDGSIPLWGAGDFDLGSEIGREAYRQVKGGWTTGVSMDLDDVTFEVHASKDLVDEAVMGNSPELAEMEEDADGRLIAATYAPDDEVSVTTDGRVRAATIVAIPAFEGARISLAAEVAEALAASGTQEFSGPNQARVPEGNPTGGQWVETSSGILTSIREGRGLGAVREKVAKEGGASINPKTLEEPTDGYMVAIQGHNKEVPADEFFGPSGEDALYDWVEANEEILSKDGSHIGLWHDEENGEVVFDVSERVDTIDEAIVLGEERNQQEVWDIANGEGIPTGGTGDRENE